MVESWLSPTASSLVPPEIEGASLKMNSPAVAVICVKVLAARL